MNEKPLIDKAYEIADKNGAILKGNLKLPSGVNCLLFAYYCKSTLFYNDLFNVAKDTIRVSRVSRKNLRKVKKVIKTYGYKKVWTKGVFSFYGDLRSLAVAAGLGEWGENGIIYNKKYGEDFLITAIFYK